MVVLAVTLTPLIVTPTRSAPATTVATVSVVPEIDPATTASCVPVMVVDVDTV
jgi:hypothetical protein